jgi:hypothetical protein
MFKAKVSKNYNAPVVAASFNIIVSTDVFTVGLQKYLTSLDSCKDTTAQWYIIENNYKNFQFNDFLGRILGVGYQNDAGLGDTPFYLILRNTPLVTIEFGKIVNNVKIPKAIVTDNTSKLPIQLFKYISFTTSVNYGIELTELQSCDGVVIIPSETPNLLTIDASNINQFFLWPQGWSRTSPSSSCFRYNVDFSQGGVMMVFTSSVPLGVIMDKSISDGYQFRISAYSVDLFKNGTWFVTQYNKVKIPRSKSVFLQVLIDNERSVVAFQIWNPATSVLKNIFFLKDNITDGVGNYFSLGSAVPRTYTSISMC